MFFGNTGNLDLAITSFEGDVRHSALELIDRLSGSARRLVFRPDGG